MRIWDYARLEKELATALLREGDTSLLAGRDEAGNYRLSQGRGELIAEAGTPGTEVEGWFLLATEDRWAIKYAAVLSFMEFEASLAPVTVAAVSAEVTAVGGIGGPVHYSVGEGVASCTERVFDEAGAPRVAVTGRTEEVTCTFCKGALGLTTPGFDVVVHYFAGSEFSPCGVKYTDAMGAPAVPVTESPAEVSCVECAGHLEQRATD